MQKNNNKGFTLLELLISLSIVSIICVTFYAFLNNSIKTNGKNERDIKALNIAQSEIENLRQQIKSKTSGSNLEIKLNDTENIIISSSNNSNTKWVNNGENEKLELIDTGIYKNYLGKDDQNQNDYSIIKYEKSNTTNKFYVNLKMFRQYIGSRYLYKIIISVNSQEEYFGKKVTTLTTEILSK